MVTAVLDWCRAPNSLDHSSSSLSRVGIVGTARGKIVQLTDSFLPGHLLLHPLLDILRLLHCA
jgi:hypothetical protein